MKKIAPLAFSLVVISWFAFVASQASYKEKESMQSQNASPTSYIKRSKLWPQLQDTLMAHGDRIEKPGQERLIMNGTLSRGRSEKLQARLILEYPDKLRLEEQDGVRVYDGEFLKSSKKALSKREEDEVESLLADSSEHFFQSQMEGRALRFLGSRFRTDDGNTPNYQGPYYAPYIMEDQIKIKKELGRQQKFFYFNSDSQLLELVRYEEKNSKKNIEVRFSNWSNINGQKVPGKITRLEDGVETSSLAFTNVTIAAAANDRIFNQP